MRLGQLARKLAISPTEIVKFLESNSIPASEGSNTRLTDDHTKLILQQFDPAGTIALSLEQSDESEPAPASIVEIPAAVVETPASVTEPVVAEAEAATETDTPETLEGTQAAENTEELPDVIKAPKVSLAGLKVLGKIDLPEPKKKETDVPENTTDAPEGAAPAAEERRPRREREDRRESRDGDGRRPRRNDTRRDDNKPRKNSVALQREREAHEAQLKREAQAKAEKERRTQHYHNRVKSVPTKPARLLREQMEEMTDDQAATPRTWLGKFWRWFRS